LLPFDLIFAALQKNLAAACPIRLHPVSKQTAPFNDERFSASAEQLKTRGNEAARSDHQGQFVAAFLRLRFVHDGDAK
jgi:hypothetical protein